MATFDKDTMRRLHDAQEVSIRTAKHPDTAVVIWLAVADSQVFARSFRGSKGRWYRDLAKGGPAELEFGGATLAVQATPANDATSIARASEEYLRKYGSSSYAQAMVKTETLATTLRLEPR